MKVFLYEAEVCPDGVDSPELLKAFGASGRVTVRRIGQLVFDHRPVRPRPADRGWGRQI